MPPAPLPPFSDYLMIEELAFAARDMTIRHFGRIISLYAPLYISNYCDNHCVYCGFHSGRDIPRKKLSSSELEAECRALAGTGIQNILILTGESRIHSPVTYIKESALTAKKYFPNIGLEIYPLETEEYRELYLAGVDGITLYQETYNREVYQKLHVSGEKRNYDYRYDAPFRMAEAGIRHISLGILLGLSDWREDIQHLFSHLKLLWRKYPGIEYSLSFPRLQIVTDDSFKYHKVTDLDMLKIITSARLLFPRVGINLSTRENPAFRDKIIGFGVTRMSAGSSTCVGGYYNSSDSHQFTVNDRRSLAQIKTMLIDKGYDPVITDWRSITNE
jgi:2-iminoacetate synthase